LVVAFPHGGGDLAGLDARFTSTWAARRDADWWIADLYAFAADMGATLVATTISRSVIDAAPLYASTGPDEAEIARRREAYFAPYHAALAAEIARLRAKHPRVVVYDAHAIRSHIPRLFEGQLPQFNIGTNGGQTCAPALEAAIAKICATSGHSHVVNGRFIMASRHKASTPSRWSWRCAAI